MSGPTQLQRVLDALPVDVGDCAEYLPGAAVERLTRRIRVAMIARALDASPGCADQTMRRFEGRNDGGVSEARVEKIVAWGKARLEADQ